MLKKNDDEKKELIHNAVSCETSGNKEIDKIEKRLNEINAEYEKLQSEEETLKYEKYKYLYRTDCSISYELTDDVGYPCKFYYVNSEGNKYFLCDEKISYCKNAPTWKIKNISVFAKYKNDFETAFYSAKNEVRKLEEEKKRKLEEDINRLQENAEKMKNMGSEWDSIFNSISNSSIKDITSDNARTIINLLLKVFHPDRIGRETKYVNNNPEIIKDVLRIKNAIL